jgi:hypothetical protein
MRQAPPKGQGGFIRAAPLSFNEGWRFFRAEHAHRTQEFR